MGQNLTYLIAGAAELSMNPQFGDENKVKEILYHFKNFVLFMF